MKVGGGSAKGASFEREISRKLSLWVSNGVSDSVFWRSAMSGGRATIGLAKGEIRASQAGDISVIDRMGHAFLEKFMVEIKFYKDLKVESFIYNTDSIPSLRGFWVKLVKDSKEFNKCPFLVAKQNRKPILVLFHFTSFTIPELSGLDKIIIQNNNLGIVICKLDDFVENVKGVTDG